MRSQEQARDGMQRLLTTWPDAASDQMGTGPVQKAYLTERPICCSAPPPNLSRDLLVSLGAHLEMVTASILRISYVARLLGAN